MPPSFATCTLRKKYQSIFPQEFCHCVPRGFINSLWWFMYSNYHKSDVQEVGCGYSLSLADYFSLEFSSTSIICMLQFCSGAVAASWAYRHPKTIVVDLKKHKQTSQRLFCFLFFCTHERDNGLSQTFLQWRWVCLCNICQRPSLWNITRCLLCCAPYLSVR